MRTSCRRFFDVEDIQYIAKKTAVIIEFTMNNRGAYNNTCCGMIGLGHGCCEYVRGVECDRGVVYRNSGNMMREVRLKITPCTSILVHLLDRCKLANCQPLCFRNGCTDLDIKTKVFSFEGLGEKNYRRHHMMMRSYICSITGEHVLLLLYQLH